MDEIEEATEAIKNGNEFEITCVAGSPVQAQPIYTVTKSIKAKITDFVECTHKDGYTVQFQAFYINSGKNPDDIHGTS